MSMHFIMQSHEKENAKPIGFAIVMIAIGVVLSTSFLLFFTDPLNAEVSDTESQDEYCEGDE